MASKNLDLEQTANNSRAFSQMPSAKGALEFDLQLSIRLVGTARDEFDLSCTGKGQFNPSDGPWSASLPLSRSEVTSRVEACRRVWDKQISAPTKRVDGNPNWNDSESFLQHCLQQRHILEAVGPNLARAGHRLFYSLFEAPVSHDDQENNLPAIAQRLRELTSQDELKINVYSNDFFVPWGMIYTHPDPDGSLKLDGSNFDPSGFWGYRHVVQHNTLRHRIASCLALNARDRLHTGVYVDEGIDANGGAWISGQCQFFHDLETVDSMVWTRRSELQQSLATNEGPDLVDRLLYFCCHGHASDDFQQPGIMLTDQELITAYDIEDWTAGKPLPSHPMIFINSCHGGQMRTRFYETVAKELLRRETAGLIGAQTDVPVVFATEFARLFFSRFLERRNRDQPDIAACETSVRAGLLLRHLARELLDEYNNPLGLVYTLYRGADCHIDWW